MTFLGPFMVTVHVVSETASQSGLQPMKIERKFGVAARVAMAPLL